MQATVKERNMRPSAALSITKVGWEWRHSTASRVSGNRYRRVIGDIHLRFKRLPCVFCRASWPIPRYFLTVNREIFGQSFADNSRRSEDTAFPDYRERDVRRSHNHGRESRRENISRESFVRSCTIALRFSLAFRHVFARLKRASVRSRVAFRASGLIGKVKKPSRPRRPSTRHPPPLPRENSLRASE